MISSENLQRVTGVYCAVHRDSLRCYVGSGVNIRGRQTGHVWEAGRYARTAFHKAIQRYGAGSFDFELLETCPREKMREREEFWILFLNAASVEGFNTTAKPSVSYSHEVSKATKQRLSRALTGRKLAPEVVAKMSSSLKGHPVSEETRQKISRGHIGRKHSPETRAKLRLARKRQVRTPEAKAKFRATMLGHAVSEETRKKISLAQKGRPSLLRGKSWGRHTEESKAAMSVAKQALYSTGRPGPRKGKVVSEESRRRMSESARRAWATGDLRERQREARTGHKRPEEVTRRIVATRKSKGYRHSEETKQKMRNTPYAKRKQGELQETKG